MGDDLDKWHWYTRTANASIITSVILPGFLCGHLPYKINHCKLFSSFIIMSHNNRVAAQVPAFLYPCDHEWLSKPLKMDQTVHKLFSIHLKFSHLSNTTFIVRSKVTTSYKKPTDHGSIPNSINSVLRNLWENEHISLCLLTKPKPWM